MTVVPDLPTSGASTTFTVRCGPRPAPVATVEVAGDLDRSAALGFRVLLREFVGDAHVVIDLTRCDNVDDAGRSALMGAVHRICHAGGEIDVVGARASMEAELVAAGAATHVRQWPAVATTDPGCD
jgi:anti-anti-sigma regulatory factor